MGTRRAEPLEDTRSPRERRIASVVIGEASGIERSKFSGEGTWRGKNKPRKEEAVREFHDFLSTSSPMLKFCGIQVSQTTKFAGEPYLYKNIREANRWCVQRFKPKLDKLTYTLASYSAEGWSSLAALSYIHPDIKAIHGLKREVREEWKLRPRFGLDKGRVEEEGY